MASLHERGSPSTGAEEMPAPTTPLTQRAPRSSATAEDPEAAMSMAIGAHDAGPDTAEMPSDGVTALQKWVHELPQFSNAVATTVQTLSGQLTSYIESELDARIRQEEALRNKYLGSTATQGGGQGGTVVQVVQ